MAISEKQLAANRANAKKSTGPKTEEGKARASINGFKSPITGLTTIMTNEDVQAQNEFVKAFINDLDPQGAVELQLARTIALDHFRLNRIKTIEENIFAYGLTVPTRQFTNDRVEIENAIGHVWTYFQQSDKINRISLYESRLNRCIKGNMELLERRQAQRKQRLNQSQPEAAPETHAMAASAASAETNEAVRKALQNESLRSPNGSVPANSETAAPPASQAPPNLQKAA
jgi:hypothetical protein